MRRNRGSNWDQVHDVSVCSRAAARSRIAQLLNRGLQDESGQSTLIVTFLFSVLLFAFLAVGIDAGYIFTMHRRAQAAADAAAVAGAESINLNSAYITTNAQAMARMNGFDNTASVNPATVTVNRPPTSGAYANGTTNASKYVEVIITKPVQTSFLGLINPLNSLINVSARAVAGGSSTVPTCICLMESTGDALNMSNNASINATQCGVVDDSSSSPSASLTGSASLSALSLGLYSSSAPTISNGGTVNSTPVVTSIGQKCSANVAAPALPSGITCYDNPIQGYTATTNYTGKYTLPTSTEITTGGVLCLNSLDTSQSASVTLTSGITYYIKNSFTTGGGSTLTGSSVNFYVGGNISIANGTPVSLTAPMESDGVTPGTLFYVNGTSVDIEGGATVTMKGLLYAPNAAVTQANGTGVTLTMDVYAQSLTMAGGAVLNSYADTNLSSLSLGGAQVVE